MNAHRITNTFLLAIALLLGLNLLRGPAVRAASGKVRIQAVSKPGVVELDGDVVGFSCVNKGAYTECSIASR